MRRDPTEFRERFAKWKTGEKVYENGLPKYGGGKSLKKGPYVKGVVSKPVYDEFDAFLQTLPDNQRTLGAYNTRRYWELNGKPKDFAEAIGKGMYSVKNDNGVLSWHANSVVYNEDSDTYEFMKPNYHPTRWMEQVYGYDQSPEFQKDWKVQYNGPMLSDRYVHREKPGLRIVGGQLPRYKGGKPDSKRRYDYKYVQAGKDNGWERITDDEMSDVFQDLVVRPKSRGGNTDTYNWNKQWALKGEPGLEIVSPEFDLLSLSPILKEGIIYGGKKIADRLGFFVQKPGTYTRGIGMTDAGVRDAIETGVFRGNPRGTEQTAKIFDKMYLKNRGNFRDIVEDTGIKGIESRYQSRTLTEEDFNALKQASKKYEYDKTSTQNQGISLLRTQSDPLHKYKNYQEYLKDISKTIQETNKMPQRIASGEVDVNNSLTNPMWFEDESGKMFLPQGRPISERFGTNSDYVSDGNPLSYWYSDGRNAITDGHAYARSNYMVRVNNPQDYVPFMHELHMHPSFFKTPKLSDPNVELFRRGPFGITIRMRKPIIYAE